MKIEGISIDTRAIAEGVYNLFDEEQIAVCAFGMLPANIMESLRRMLGERIEEVAKSQCQKQYGFQPNRECAKADLKKRFVSEALRQIAIEIYGIAKEYDALLV
jgi:hypothetical protein